ncbi:hypothetical protein BDR03DRAFT_576295 [Suillus americanus]|nr:hypothetical protein BDR03DRAFT_576295 [Suillus americanus]
MVSTATSVMHLQLFYLRQYASQSLYVVLNCGGAAYYLSVRNIVIRSIYNSCKLLSYCPNDKKTHFLGGHHSSKERHSERPALCCNDKCRDCRCLWQDLSQVLLVGTVSQIIYGTMRLLQSGKYVVSCNVLSYGQTGHCQLASCSS